jgi:hypothetical protein
VRDKLVEASQIGTMVPVANERQARELAPLLDQPDPLRDAWAEASENGEPTAVIASAPSAWQQNGPDSRGTHRGRHAVSSCGDCDTHEHGRLIARLRL